MEDSEGRRLCRPSRFWAIEPALLSSDHGAPAPLRRPARSGSMAAACSSLAHARRFDSDVAGIDLSMPYEDAWLCALLKQTRNPRSGTPGALPPSSGVGLPPKSAGPKAPRWSLWGISAGEIWGGTSGPSPC